MKCLRYWPTDVDGEVTIGKVTVKLVSESKLTGYVIRNLKVRQVRTTSLSNGKNRLVKIESISRHVLTINEI